MAQAEARAFTEYKVTLPTTDLDLVSDYVVEHVTNGMVVEEEEGSDEVTLIFYLNQDTGDDPTVGLHAYLSSLFSAQDATPPELRSRLIKDIEWIEIYRQSVRPVAIGDDIVIRPPWCDPASVEYDLIIEPRMAFGTGTHGSTQGCLAAIRKHFKSGGRFLDLGCGSGILSILAAKMGAVSVKAIDYDEIAVDNCRENFQINAVNCPSEIVHGSIEQCQADKPYELVCANIIRETILEMLDRLVELTLPGGYLVLSGLLEEDLAQIRAALGKQDHEELLTMQVEDWHTMVIKRP